MKRLLYLFPLLALFLFASCDSSEVATESSDEVAFETQELAALSKGAKVDVCHRTSGTNPWILTNVSVKAVSAHLAHGDASPGDPVPGMADFIFDDACQPVGHAWGDGPLFTYEANPDGARHFFWVVSEPVGGGPRFCDFTSHPNPVDLVLNDGTVIGNVSVDCSVGDEMSMTFNITDAGYVLQEIAGLTDSKPNCENLDTPHNVPLTDLSQYAAKTPFVEYTSKAAAGLTTETLDPIDVIANYTGGDLSCAVAHALVSPT